MKKSVNQILEEQFNRAFTYAVKMREAEEKQNPFSALVYKNKQGEVYHQMRICKN
jgi:hypothetical protein